MIGKTLNHYKIIRQLGSGGMGEVYLAEDTSLDRQVALKVLPSDLASDPERRQRLEREAKAIAALDHPNIVTVFSVEEADATAGRAHFITMQLVEGKTLSELIPRNGFPLERFFDLAIPLADAISAAHEQGIVHRDLKPANIMVSDDGRVRVLDFGLAKLREEAAGVGGQSELATVQATSGGPAQPLTEEGKILGTVAYMSPEQAEGKLLDHRTDIFSLGIILYEMATGERPFKGDTNVSVISSIVKDTPASVTKLNRNLPRHLGRIVKHSLEKEVSRRYHAAADLRNDLDELKGEIVSGELVAGTAIVVASKPLWQRALPWSLVALMAVAAGVSMWVPWRTPPSPALVARLSISLPQTQYLPSMGRPGLAISPDGTRLIYLGCVEGDRAQCQLYLHEFDTGDSRSIGVGYNPSFSPDGRWIGFRRQDTMMKVEVEGGASPIPLTKAARGGFSWWTDDTIVFCSGPGSGLSRIPAAGGEPEVLTRLNTDAGERAHAWPHVLPNGRGVIFNVKSDGEWDDAQIVVQSFETGERHFITKGAYPRYVPTGHLVYVRRAEGAPTYATGTLYAVPFDVDHLQTVGPEIPVQEGVYFDGDGSGLALYTFSDTGRLVYAPGLAPDSRVVLVDLEGKADLLQASPQQYAWARFSPDGNRLALTVGAYPDRLDLYELDQKRQSVIGTHFTDGDGTVWEFDTGVEWHPEGDLLAIGALSPSLTYQVVLISLDSSVELERPAPSDREQVPLSWTPDGKLLYGENDPQTGTDIWEVTLDEDRSTRLLVGGPRTQSQPVVSPDMRWLAHTSNHTGQTEVWVRPYDRPGRAVQASIDGGHSPIWAPDGREIYFRKGEQMLAVDIVTEPELSAGAPRMLFAARYSSSEASLFRGHDLAPDGKHFVMIQEGERWGTRLEVAENWFEELKRLVPTGR